MCMYTYILQSCRIYVCLYDQVIMLNVFIYDWCYVLMCLYTYILQSCEIYVCLYDRDMMSLIFHVWMCLYTYILWSYGTSICLYNQATRSLILYLEKCMYACVLQSCGMLVYEHSWDTWYIHICVNNIVRLSQFMCTYVYSYPLWNVIKTKASCW
jgi:hypothetical protein